MSRPKLNILDLIKPIVLIFVAYNFCDISLWKSYDGLDGLWHGFNAFGNFVLSIFSRTIAKSSNGSLGYNISWWIVVGFQLLVFAILYLCRVVKIDDCNEKID